MRFLRNRGLVFKQCFWIMLCIGVVAGAIYVLVRAQAVKMLRDSLQQQAMQIGEGTVNRMDQTFFESMRVAELLAARLGERGLTRAELQSVMKETLTAAHAARPSILALAVAYEPGAFGNRDELMELAVCTADGVDLRQGGNYLAKPWYRNSKEQNRGVWCEPFIGDFVTEPIAIYTLPFYEIGADGSRKFAGIVCVDLSIAWLRELVDDLHIENSGYAFLLSGKGRVVAHPNPDWVYNKTVDELAVELGNRQMGNIGINMTAGRRGFAPYTAPGGVKSWIYFMPLASNGWSFGIVFPEARMFEKVDELQNITAAAGCLGLAALLAVVIAVTMRISRPLKKLAVVAREIGKGNFKVDIPKIPGGDELGIFARAFRHMRVSLVEHMENLRKVTSAKEKIESELKVAQSIQMGILPEILPPFPKCDYFEIDALLNPAREVGGDLYDFFMLSDTAVCLAVGDVSGKGVPASLFMAVTQTLHRGLARGEKIDAEAIVSQMNYALCHQNSASMFVTYVFGAFDLVSGVFSYCNAGHNPFCLMRAGGEVTLAAVRHGIPLGVDADAEYGRSELKLSPGDSLFFYTDGVTEAKNALDEFFGEKRLLAVLAEANRSKASPAEVTRAVAAAVAEFVGGAEQFDDITMLCVRITALAAVDE
ncbi:MAG: SpoIIE family protein phosphatase [Victivallaceae bacterium]|nr:SpoIIE family protein phosphatase [Victivallaceae bacterium]